MPAYAYFGTIEDFGVQHTEHGGASARASIANIDPAFTLVTPAGGIRITELARGMESGPQYAGITFRIGIIDITDGLTATPVLAQATASVRTDNAGYVWHTVDGLDVLIPAGRTIAVMCGAPSSEVWTTQNIDGQAYYTPPSVPEATFPSTWTPNGIGRTVPMRAGYSLANPDPEIVSINGNNVVRPGTSGNQVVTVGIGTLTSLTFGGKAATSLAAPSGTGTFTMPALADEQVYSLFGNVTALATDGTKSDTLTVSLLPPEGWDYVPLTGTLNTSDTGTLEGYTAVPGDQILFPLSCRVDAQGNVETDTNVQLWHIAESTKIARIVQFNVVPAGSTGTPQGVQASTALGPAVARGAALRSAVGVSASAAVGTVTARGAALAAAAGRAIASALGAVIATGGSGASSGTASPAGVSAVAAFGAATARGAALATAGGAAAASALGSVIARGAALVVAAGRSMTASVGAMFTPATVVDNNLNLTKTEVRRINNISRAAMLADLGALLADLDSRMSALENKVDDLER